MLRSNNSLNPLPGPNQYLGMPPPPREQWYARMAASAPGDLSGHDRGEVVDPPPCMMEQGDGEEQWYQAMIDTAASTSIGETSTIDMRDT